MDSDKGPDKGIFASLQPHTITRIAISCTSLVGISLHTLKASLIDSDHNPNMREIKYGQIPDFGSSGLWQHLSCVRALPSPFDKPKSGSSFGSPSFWSCGLEIEPLNNIFILQPLANYPATERRAPWPSRWFQIGCSLIFPDLCSLVIPSYFFYPDL